MPDSRTSIEQLHRWMKEPEGEHLEFKEAKNNFHFETLVKYCAALANEGGGRMILGVTDRPPRSVVGTSAFRQLERTKAGLVERLRIRIDVNEVPHPGGRVLVFHVPSRPLGIPIQYEGAFWMRAGQQLAPMTVDMLRRILAEIGPDFTAEICPSAPMDAIDPRAVEIFRSLWRRKSGNEGLDRLDEAALLAAAELTVDGKLTYAALILMGTEWALGRFLPQAELVYEYRSSEASIGHQHREEFRQGFFLWMERLGELIELRNEVQQLQQGLFRFDIAAFNEAAIRESVLNAVSHRDYRLPGSIFVRQYPRRLEFVSPGGFPPGVTAENIVWRQSPRNRRIAEAFARCGLVERSGQGADRIFAACVREGKPPPDFSASDDTQVSLVLRGEIPDPQFLLFLEKLGKQRLSMFATEDLLVLDAVHWERKISDTLKSRLNFLLDQGVIEQLGRGRGTRYVLARGFYDFIGKRGTYTRKRGLDRETNKALLLKHIRENNRRGVQLGELMEVLPSLTRRQVQALLEELRSDGRIRLVGKRKVARWYPS